MRTIFLSIFVSLTISVIGGCGGGAKQTAEKTANEQTTAQTSTKTEAAKPVNSPEKAADVPKSDLKPDKIDLEKPFDATDIRNAAMADLEAWKGKELTAIGHGDGSTVSTLSGGLKSTNIKVKNDQSEIVISCTGPKPPPADLLSNNKNRIVKGTVKGLLVSFKQLELNPCEVIN